MARTNKGTELEHEVPDPVRRLEILIDGDKGYGVRGLRDRVARNEKWILVGIVTGFGNIGLAVANGSGDSIVVILRAIAEIWGG